VYPELGISVTYKQGIILFDVGDMCFDVKDDGGL
jgi:centromeric protein E